MWKKNQEGTAKHDTVDSLRRLLEKKRKKERKIEGATSFISALMRPATDCYMQSYYDAHHPGPIY